MRRALVATLVAFLALGSFAATSTANWEYDSEAKTISDGVWTFSATLSGSNISIGLIKKDGHPDEISPLDFSKKVVKKGDPSTEYMITKIGSMFYHYSGGKVWEPGAELIGKFTLPGEGLITMDGDGPSPENSNNSNLYGDIVVPSTVTYIGRYWFNGAKITSIVFGAGKATVGSTICASCYSLTSVVFRAGGEYKFENNSRPFSACSNLKDADLSGVVWIGGDSSHAAFGSCSSLTNITLNSNLFLTNSSSTLGTIGNALFNANDKLTTIHFTGAAPDDLQKWIDGDGGYLGVLPSSRTVKTIVPAEYRNVKNSSGKSWADYSASGRLNTTDSTFASAYVKDGTDPSKRKLIMDRLPDDDPPTITEVSSDVWPYKAVVTVDGYGLAGGAVSVSLTNDVGEVAGSTELDAFGKSCTFNSLSANTHYSIVVVATNIYGAVTNGASAFTTLEAPMHLTVQKTVDIDQATGASGAFVISRSDGDSLEKSVEVIYSASGTAESGKDYVALPGTVTIPSGEKSVTFGVAPMYNAELEASRTLTLTLQTAKTYEIVGGSADMTISQSKAFDGWTYNGTSISKDGWTFNATVSGTDMTIGSCTAWPDAVSPLDFSPIVVSSEGTYYKIVKLGVYFGYYDDKKDYRVGRRDPQSYRVGALTVPAGVERIEQYAFGGCTNLTFAAPLPASLKYIGDYAFSSTKITGDHVLTNLTYIGAAALAGTKVTSLAFGPNLTQVSTSYDRGFVNDCSSLTNIVFDPTATTGQIGQFTFKGCSKLTELDLSTFTSFQDPTKSANSAIRGCTSLKRIIFSGKMKCIYPWTLYTSDNVKQQLDEVVFTGVPPVSVFTNYLVGVNSAKTVTTYVHKKLIAVTNAAGKCWNDYAAESPVYYKNTTWKGDYLVDGVNPAKRPLLTLEYPGLKIIVR